MAIEPRIPARAFGALTGASVRWRWMVIAAWLLIAVGSVVLASSRLGINTDTTDMLSPELQFRKDFTAFRNAFPQGKGSLVVVVTGPTSDLTDRAARRLSAALLQDKQLFRSVFFPQGDRFFRRNGLLYLSLKDLEALSDRLTEAQPVLGLFVKEPNLAGLAAGLETVLRNIGTSRIPTGRLVTLLNEVSRSLEAAAVRRSHLIDWSKLLGGFGDGRTVVIVTQPRLTFTSLSPAKKAMDATRDAARRLGLTPEKGFTVNLTGSAAISSEEISSVSLGAGRAGLLSLAFVLMLLFIGLRQLWAIGAVAVSLIAGLAVTLGFVAVAIGELNLISVAFAVLFIGLGVDFGIHFALRRSEFAEGQSPFARAATSVGPALALSAVAAALAFLAFLFTDYRGVAELGLIAAVGMGIALASSLTLLPAIQSLRAVKPAPGAPSTASPDAPRPADRLVLALAGLLAVASAVAVPFVGFDRNPLNLKDPGAESVQTAVRLVNHPRYGLTPIQVLVESRDKAEALAKRLRSLPEVRSVRTIGSFLPAEQDDKREILDELRLLLAPVFAGHAAFKAPWNAIDPATLRPAPARAQATLSGLIVATRIVAAGEQKPKLAAAARRLGAAVRQLLVAKPDKTRLDRLNADMTEGLVLRLASLAEGLDPQEVTQSSLPAALRERYVAPSGAFKVEVLPKANLQDNRALKAFVAAVQNVAPFATGAPVVELLAGNAVIDAFLLATALAAGFILLLLIVVLRRGLDVILVMAPVALAGLLTVGTVVLLGQTFNFANIIAVPLLEGLGAAGGIHVVTRWRARQSVSGTADRRSTTGRAILFSALTTVASFGTLAVSPHRGTASMGELLMIAIGWSLICTLVFLPAALRLFAPRIQNHG